MTTPNQPPPGRNPVPGGPYGPPQPHPPGPSYPEPGSYWDDYVDARSSTRVQTPPTRERPDEGDPPPGNRRSGRHQAPRRRTANRSHSFARELPFLVLVAFGLALLIKAFLVQAFWIPSGSMERTLLVNDRVLVNKVVYDFRSVHRGEIVVFNGDGTGFEQAEENQSVVSPPSNIFERGIRDVQNLLGLGAPSNKDFIKRVIAVGGDTVECCDALGRVKVNGHPLDEPYLYDNTQPVNVEAPTGRSFPPTKVPPHDLWVMGDHRAESSDSRAHGPIPESKVVGRAFVRVWPASRMAFLRVPKSFQEPLASGLSAPGVLAGVIFMPIALGRRRRLARLRAGTARSRPRRLVRRDRAGPRLGPRRVLSPSQRRARGAVGSRTNEKDGRGT